MEPSGGEAATPDDLRAVGQEGLESVAEATNPTTDDPFVELGLVDHDRWVAPGGWPRGLIGFAVGAAAGWLVTVAHRGDARAHRARRGGP